MRLIILCVSAVLVSSCGYYLSPRPGIMERKIKLDTDHGSTAGTQADANKVEKHRQTHRYGVLATAADYRVVVFNGESGKFCSEASPDAVAQVAQNFATALDASSENTKVSAEAQLTIATTMVQLTRRSQGLQLYRDGSFAICNALVNGFIDSNQAVKLMTELRLTSADLIKAEIPTLQSLVLYSPEAPVASMLHQMEREAKSASPTKPSTNKPTDSGPAKSSSTAVE